LPFPCSEEKALFQRLQELNPSLLRRLCTRCFFAVNKVDVMGRQDGMGPEETQQYVAELITEQLGVPGFELRPEQVRHARQADVAELAGGRGILLARFSKSARLLLVVHAM
jgi:hypothetical protein